MSEYVDFLRAKAVTAPQSGIEISLDDLHPLLTDPLTGKPHQGAIVQWAARGGRRAIFANFGLGKTFMQLELLRILVEREGGRGLIILPLNVRTEFAEDAAKLGIDLTFVRSIDECGRAGLYVTNYETVRDGRLDPNHFTAVSLDEASVLRSFGSKTYQTFLTLFENVRYRFVATATPSPNRFKEIIHYAGFLGVMDTGEALTRFFQRNSEKAGDLTLYPHKEKEFWLWVASWAVMLQRPSDLGFSDEGYDLPEMTVRWHEVASEIAGDVVDRDGQAAMFRDPAVSLSAAAREKRESLKPRIDAMLEVLRRKKRAHHLIWHDLEAEREAIEEALPEARAIYGTQDLDEREQTMLAFKRGKLKHLAAKPVMAGSGCNFQHHCADAVFLGVGYKFNDFIQAIHRIHRFQQAKPVTVTIIYTENEREVRRELEAKWARHVEMQAEMAAIIREFGLDQLKLAESMARSIGCARRVAEGEGWRVVNDDCVEHAQAMEANSVDMIVTSIPFSNHYEYTPSYNDFGHTSGDDHFFAQMDFLTPQLLRILKPGRVAAVHVKDRILFGSVTGDGMPTVNPFHARCIGHYMAHGFAYMGMITVVTDVVRENNQTYRLGYTEMRKDGSKMGVGSPEYVLLLRKLPTDRSRAYADERVIKSIEDYSLARWQADAHAFWRSSGNRHMTAAEWAELDPQTRERAFEAMNRAGLYDFGAHMAITEELERRNLLPKLFMHCAPRSTREDVWDDVARMRTLNGEQAAKGREKHICPLQFDIVDRLIERYSNKGDLVFDPFGGLFTVPVRALMLGRRGTATELNPGYFDDGVRFLKATEAEISVPSLFDLVVPTLEAAE